MVHGWDSGSPNYFVRPNMDFMNRKYDGRTNTLANHVVADPVGFLHCGNFLSIEPSEHIQVGIAHKPVLWTYLRKQE